MRQVEFDTLRAQGSLHIAFVGMSNAGKSYRSRALHDYGFEWFDIDTEIAQALGLTSVDDVAVWLGGPETSAFAGKQDRYLALEDQCVQHACDVIRNDKNAVCDTTGSVVHLSSQTQKRLQESFLVVHLHVGEDGVTRMIEKFFERPKPVTWGSFLQIRAGESTEDAIRRSYPLLLEERLRRYEQLAHVTVSAQSLRDTTAEVTLQVIRDALPV